MNAKILFRIVLLELSGTLQMVGLVLNFVAIEMDGETSYRW